MRRMWALLMVCLVSFPVSASQGGQNESISLEGTGIEALYYDEVMRTSNLTSDYADFIVTMLMEDDSNISNIRWITQVCINSGICHPPQEIQMNRGDDGSFGSRLGTEAGYSYINWKFIIELENGSESHVPDIGFGWRVWSDCWFDNGTWGGSETHCKEEDSALPGFTVSMIMASTATAALMGRRD